MFREQQFSFDSDQFSHLKSFRIYAVGAISSFSAFLDKYDSGTPLTWGRYSFASFAQMIGLHQFGSFGFYDDYLDISQTSNDYTNVYTIFRSLIEDFGIKGSILYMLTLGIITRMAYSCAVEGSLPALSFILGIYAMFVYSPIAPLTQHNSIIISWILPAFILSIITKNKKTYSVLQ
jgi:oligosaccharide repeat unit polymerase